MKKLPALVAMVVIAALGLLVGGFAGASSSASPIAGTWSSGGHLLKVSGDLASGFSVVAGQSWTIIGCPISTGEVLSKYSPKGGSSYDAMYLWTENDGGKCTNSTRGPETVSVVLSGNTLTISGCGYAFCGTLARVGGAATTTTTRRTTTAPTTAPTTTRRVTTTASKQTTTAPTTTAKKPVAPAKDTTPPSVRAFALTGVRPASRPELQFTVYDNSKRARVHATLYEDGKAIASTVSRFGPATGSRWTWKVLFRADLRGPLAFCVWADDVAGNRSRDSGPDDLGPLRGSCAWISLVVRVETVSNGCGGGGWEDMVTVQNYFGNVHYFSNSNINPLAHSYKVDFMEACNIHDAGYGGHTVKDVINGDVIRDFHTWSRRLVDAKFLKDLRKLCRDQIPDEATVARDNCEGRGGNASIGAESLFNFVHKFGWHFFDANLAKPGIQTTGYRPNF